MYSVAEGQKIELQCKTFGSPQPSVTWWDRLDSVGCLSSTCQNCRSQLSWLLLGEGGFLGIKMIMDRISQKSISLKWILCFYREGESWDSLMANPRMIQLSDGSLQINNASFNDSGQYTCTVKNDKITITAELDVLSELQMHEYTQLHTCLTQISWHS